MMVPMSAGATQPIRILLVDEHTIDRAGLRLLIESQPGLCVVGEASDAAGALALLGREQADLIVLDIDQPYGAGFEALAGLTASAAQPRVLALTREHDYDRQRRAAILGAMGVVTKDQTVAVLLKAIEKVHAGEIWFERAILAKLLGEMAHPAGGPHEQANGHAARLTERELEVVALICEGLQNKQIATRMGISETTVRHRLTSIFSKLGVASRLELLVYAQRHELLRQVR